MNIIFNKIVPTIKLAQDDKMVDLLAYVSIKLLDEKERHITINGFTIRKSKFDSKPYLVPPSKSIGKGFFKFCLTEKSLWKELEKDILNVYDYESIPVID